MSQLKRFMTTVFTVTAISLSAHDMSPKQESQLKTVFPEAVGFMEKHVSLTDKQAAQASTKISGKLGTEDREVRLLAAKSVDGGILGHAVYFSVKDKDGDTVKGLVGLGTDGMVKKAVIFSHDKADPVAQEGFLSQFAGKSTDLAQWGKAVKPAPGREAASKAAAKAIHKATVLAETASMARMANDEHDDDRGDANANKHGHKGHAH